MADPAPTQRQRIIAARRAHWRRTRRLTGALLALWFVTSFCTVFFARELNGLTLFGWPLSFYMAGQGAQLIYLAIIGVYAWAMHRVDLRFVEQLSAQPDAQPDAQLKSSQDAP